MNTSQLIDKQIMDLSNFQNSDKGKDDFIDLINHPISGTRNYGFIDSMEPAKVNTEKDRDVYDAALISEIDRTMKKHADNLMHALEGVCARLSQLENKSCHLENSIDDLKASAENNHGSTDGELRQIENMIREVQAGVQVVKDKHEILDARLQLSQVEIFKAEQQSEILSGHMESMQQAAASAPLQSHCQLPPSAHAQSLPYSLSNAPPPPAPLKLAPPVHHPNQFPQNVTPISQHDSYYQTSGQTPETPPQQYQLPPPPQQFQPPQVAPPSPQPQYPPPPHIQISQPPPLHQQHPSLSSANPTQSQPPVGHHLDERPYLQSQNFLPSIQQPGVVLPPLQKSYRNPSQVYEPSLSRPVSGLSSHYGQSPGHGEPYPYGSSPSQYGAGSPIKPRQHSSLNVGPSGGSSYPQIPTTKILPHTLPTASGVGSGSGSSSTLPHALPTASGVGGGSGSSFTNSGNRVPIDDVVDKVTNMGFPRDQVRATVRKLTENGQAVDLNVVLDKLMTDGVESQGPRDWFGR